MDYGHQDEWINLVESVAHQVPLLGSDRERRNKDRIWLHYDQASKWWAALVILEECGAGTCYALALNNFCMSIYQQDIDSKAVYTCLGNQQPMQRLCRKP